MRKVKSVNQSKGFQLRVSMQEKPLFSTAGKLVTRYCDWKIS